MKKLIKNLIILQILIALLFSLSSCATLESASAKSVASYEINATYEEKTHSLSGEVVINYEHSGENTLTSLSLNLYANAYQKEGGGIVVDGVYLEDKKAGFSLKGKDKTILEIPLNKELYPGEKVSAVISFTLTIPELEGRFGVSGDTVRLSGWYPQLCAIVGGVWQEREVERLGDYFYSDASDYTVRLTVKKDSVVASSAKRVATTLSENTETHTYEGKGIRDFAFCISDKYEVVSAVSGATLISCYAFSEEECESIISYAQKAFNLYSERYGRYPYPVYSVALCEMDNGGMEFSGIVYVNRALEGLELEKVVAHETAHQWWYGSVGSDPTRYAWLDEGLSEFCTLEYIEEIYGSIERNKLVEERNKAYSAFCSVYKNLKGSADIPMTKNISSFESEYEYVMVTYYKGELFFENLNAIMGRNKLDSGLKKYYSSFSGDIATPEGLAFTLSEVCKISFEPIFEAWESGKVYFGV